MVSMYPRNLTIGNFQILETSNIVWLNFRRLMQLNNTITKFPMLTHSICLEHLQDGIMTMATNPPKTIFRGIISIYDIKIV